MSLGPGAGRGCPFSMCPLPLGSVAQLPVGWVSLSLMLCGLIPQVGSGVSRLSSRVPRSGTQRREGLLRLCTLWAIVRGPQPGGPQPTPGLLLAGPGLLPEVPPFGCEASASVLCFPALQRRSGDPATDAEPQGHSPAHHQPGPAGAAPWSACLPTLMSNM